MKIYNFQEEKQKRYEGIIEKGRSIAFPNADTVEDNLKLGEKVYRFMLNVIGTQSELFRYGMISGYPSHK